MKGGGKVEGNFKKMSEVFKYTFRWVKIEEYTDKA